MLRNAAAFNIDKVNVPFLNEVLSLNAQECKSRRCTDGYVTFLNEVLSLNAQELIAQIPQDGELSPQ